MYNGVGHAYLREELGSLGAVGSEYERCHEGGRGGRLNRVMILEVSSCRRFLYAWSTEVLSPSMREGSSVCQYSTWQAIFWVNFRALMWASSERAMMMSKERSTRFSKVFGLWRCIETSFSSMEEIMKGSGGFMWSPQESQKNRFFP